MLINARYEVNCNRLFLWGFVMSDLEMLLLKEVVFLDVGEGRWCFFYRFFLDVCVKLGVEMVNGDG